MRVLQFNAAYAPDFTDPEALLDRYEVLTGWSEALVDAGACTVAVVQRFHRDAHVVRRGVEYWFCADTYPPEPPTRMWLPNAYRRAAAWRPDIVHVNGLNLPVQYWALRRYVPSSTAVVVQDHAGRPLRSSSNGAGSVLRRAVSRRGLASVDGFLFTARGLAHPWLDAGLIGRDQPVLEVPAMSTRLVPVPREEARQITGVSGDPAVLWVGRLASIKDPLTVLNGFASARGALPRAVLTIVHSGGELLDDVRQVIGADPRLSDRVRLVANVPREQIASFFSAADLFVSGSRHEACGLALLEAMACGVQPVVPDIPAFAALTGRGACGVLWAPGDAESCAQALRRAGQGERSRARIRDYFNRTLTWPHIGRAALDAYHTIAHRRVAG